MVELVNLVSPVNFSISNDLTQMFNFPSRISDCDSHSPLLDFFLSSNASICCTMGFPRLGNSDHVVVSVSFNFSSKSKRDAPFHHIAHNYSFADWDGRRDHLRDIPWEDIFKFSDSAVASEFVRGFRLELMYLSLLVNIRSSLTHLHSFQLLVLLPQFTETTFFVCTNRIKLLKQK